MISKDFTEKLPGLWNFSRDEAKDVSIIEFQKRGFLFHLEEEKNIVRGTLYSPEGDAVYSEWTACEKTDDPLSMTLDSLEKRMNYFAVLRMEKAIPFSVGSLDVTIWPERTYDENGKSYLSASVTKPNGGYRLFQVLDSDANTKGILASRLKDPEVLDKLMKTEGDYFHLTEDGCILPIKTAEKEEDKEMEDR